MIPPVPSRAAILGAVIVLLAAPAAGQRVDGVVVNPDTEAAVARARVLLVAPDDLVVVDSTVTDGEGRFQLPAPPGQHVLVIQLEGYLTVSAVVDLGAGEVADRRFSMPLISTAAARLMGDAIDREAAFQLPLDELCQEPLRPWEAGVLLGVTRDRRTLTPIPGALVTLGPVAPDSFAVRSRLSTDSGAFWFCNVPGGQVRVVARAAGMAPDTTLATVRNGTISWYDGLLRPRR